MNSFPGPFGSFPGVQLVKYLAKWAVSGVISAADRLLTEDGHPVDFKTAVQTENTGAWANNDAKPVFDYDSLAGVRLYARVAQDAATGDGEVKFVPYGGGADFTPTLTIPQGTTVVLRGGTMMANVDSTGSDRGRIQLKSGQNGKSLALFDGSVLREVLS